MIILNENKELECISRKELKGQKPKYVMLVKLEEVFVDSPGVIYFYDKKMKLTTNILEAKTFKNFFSYLWWSYWAGPWVFQPHKLINISPYMNGLKRRWKNGNDVNKDDS